jgi:nucleoside-diphosphate-sugar epimerase
MVSGVTGAAGFIGGRLVEDLARLGPVVGIDRYTAALSPDRSTHAVAELVDPRPAAAEILRAGDVVFHLAGCNVRNARSNADMDRHRLRRHLVDGDRQIEHPADRGGQLGQLQCGPGADVHLTHRVPGPVGRGHVDQRLGHLRDIGDDPGAVRRAEQVEHTLADTTQLGQIIGWVPRTDLHGLGARQVADTEAAAKARRSSTV